MASFDVSVDVLPNAKQIDVRTAADAYTSNGFVTFAAHHVGTALVNPSTIEGLETADTQFLSEGETINQQNIIVSGGVEFNLSNQRNVNVFIASENTNASTKLISFGGGGTLSSFTGPVGASGYTVTQSGNSVEIASTGAWGNLPVIRATTTATNFTDVTIANVSGNALAVGIQAVSASTTAVPPPNCLKGSTPVVVDLNGTTRPIQDLVSGDTVVVRTPSGERREVTADILVSRGYRGDEVYKVDGDVESSAIHMFLKPTDLLCRSCGKPKPDGDLHSCRHARHFNIPSFGVVMASNLVDPYEVASSEPWYHVSLENFGWCVELGNGWLSEGFRHKLGTHAKDERWAKVEGSKK